MPPGIRFGLRLHFLLGIIWGFGGLQAGCHLAYDLRSDGSLRWRVNGSLAASWTEDHAGFRITSNWTKDHLFPLTADLMREGNAGNFFSSEGALLFPPLLSIPLTIFILDIVVDTVLIVSDSLVIVGASGADAVTAAVTTPYVLTRAGIDWLTASDP